MPVLWRSSRRVAPTGEDCPVCMEARWGEKGAVTLPCGHRLCLECYGKLRETSDRCPLCRRELPGGGSVPAREATSVVAAAAAAAETSIDLLDSIEPRLDRYLRETEQDRAELLEVMLSPRVSVQTKASLLRAILRVHMRSFMLANLRRMWTRRRRNAIVG